MKSWVSVEERFAIWGLDLREVGGGKFGPSRGHFASASTRGDESRVVKRMNFIVDGMSRESSKFI